MVPCTHFLFEKQYRGAIKGRSWPPWSAMPVIVSDTLEQVVPVGEENRVTVHAEVVPEISLAPQVLPEPLVDPVGQLEVSYDGFNGHLQLRYTT